MLASSPLDARSAKPGITIVSRPSVRPSVRLSVMLMYREHIGWTSSKIITRIYVSDENQTRFFVTELLEKTLPCRL